MKRSMKKEILVISIMLLATVSQLYSQIETPIHLRDLKQLSENIDKKDINEKKILSMGYHKRSNGVYISNVMLTTKAPKHWITTFAYLSYQTANRPSFDRIVRELKKEGRSKKFDTGTSQMGYKYRIPKYEVEVYMPLNGVDLDLNDLYEIILMPKKN
ncbi:hypothetical protein [Pedobacter sp. WC2423]|uniref:hypothetical protein n=1 Tax=Pedobacter sp. WC2423 TaxID=3234142 RepID=UPI003465114F